MSGSYEKEIREKCNKFPNLLDEKISQLNLRLSKNSGMFDVLILVKRSNLTKVKIAIAAEESFDELTSCDLFEVHEIIFSS